MNMRNAFSLVELSIVLVILGLLVGGVLSGQSLIRASELRAVTTEYQRYSTAIQTFRDKYFALPGDMANAQSFWAAAAACPGINSTAAGGTCNGNADGMIGNTSGANGNEMFRSWQHMALAGLIEGNYTGVPITAVAADVASTAGTDVPKSKVSSGAWWFSWLGPRAISDTAFFDGNYSNVFIFGAISAGSYPTSALLKPEEAWNIDTKLDDGKPATGLVTTLESQGTTCSDLAASAAATLTSSVYLLSNTALTCTLVFKSGV